MPQTLPHLNRDSIWRILRDMGLSRRRTPVPGRPVRGEATFPEDDLGFVPTDIKHLPKLETANGERRKRYFLVAIDRRSRSVHLAVKDDETERGAIAFLREAAKAFAFRLTPVLTGNGHTQRFKSPRQANSSSPPTAGSKTTSNSVVTA